MIDPIDINTFGGLSVAHNVAMRPLSDSEITAIKQKDPHLLERVSKVMNRISFVDELRYSVHIDLTNPTECNHRNALETYLLCTCFDTLSGKDNYVELQSWLKAHKLTVLGISDRDAILQGEKNLGTILSSESFSSTISKILESYNRHYGVNQNINLLVTSLPTDIKTQFANEFTIIKETWETSWENKTIDEKLKVIFIEYLFNFRRNLFTHESKSFPSFGGICLMRENLNKGIIELPIENTYQFPNYDVTCHHGDESLFIREFLFACLAHKLGVLSPEWRNLYKNAERQKRMLYALLYEIKHNIQVMQAYFEILLEPLIVYSGNGQGSYKLETKVAQSLTTSNFDILLPIDRYFLESYIEAASQFNSEIDSLYGTPVKNPFDETSRIANALINSKVRMHGQELGKRCIQLLNDYPEWVYSKTYQPTWSFSL